MEKKGPSFLNYRRPLLSEGEMLTRAQNHYAVLNKRRSCRYFSEHPVPRAVIELIIQTAASAPSGAHQQPWTFVAVSKPSLKRKIRMAAEQEEKAFYAERATEEWLEALAPIGTDWQKPFLETAPWLIILFKQSYGQQGGDKKKHYYVNESVGIAAGFLIEAIHHCGLSTLTHTPSPMNFLSDLLERPENEKPFLLLPVGFTASNAKVPALKRKPLTQVAKFIE